MSSLKATFGSLLSTMSSTATVVTSTLNAASTGAAMLNQYAEFHSQQQRKDYAVLSLSSDDVASEKAAISQIERLRSVKSMNLSPEELVLFAATQERVKLALVNAK